MGQILNSKGEFSRCYIPRLVIEEEDKEAKEERLSMEKQERDLVTKLLDEDDDEWEKRKQRDRELRDKKRGRGTCNEEDETPILDQGKKRRVKRLKFDVIKEDWGKNEEGGEHDDQQEPVLPPPPVIRRRGAKSSKQSNLLTSVITDFYSPAPKRRRMSRFDDKSWSEEDEFPSYTEGFELGGEDRGTLATVEEEDDLETEEFGDISWFEEETSRYLGRDSLGCAGRPDKDADDGDQASKEGEMGNKDDHEASKDDLGESWSDHEEFMDRTVSFIFERDPSHPRVTEPDTPGSKGSREVPDKYQEEDHMVEVPITPGSPARIQDPWGLTTVQEEFSQSNQFMQEGHIGRDGGCGAIEEVFHDTNGPHMEDIVLKEGADDHLTTRKGQEDRKNGIVEPASISTLAPSSGGCSNTASMDGMKSKGLEECYAERTGLTSHATRMTSLDVLKEPRDDASLTSKPGLLGSKHCEVGMQRDGRQDSNSLSMRGDDDEGIRTSQNTIVTSQEGTQEECVGGIPLCCSTPSSSQALLTTRLRDDRRKDAPLSSRSLSMKDIGEESMGSGQTMNTEVEDGLGHGERTQTKSCGEPSVGSGRNYTPGATGKHMVDNFNANVLEGVTDDKPGLMDESDRQETNDEEAVTGGRKPPRRQPGAGVQEGGPGARCSYAPGGICNLHGPGAKLRWKTTVGEYRPGVKTEKKRHYFYVCLTKPEDRPRGGLRQSTLSFARVAGDSRNTEGDTDVQTRKVGQ